MTNFGSLVQTALQSVLLAALILATISVSYAEVRTSASYQLQSDSVNFGGGLSTSTSYSLESTAGEVATGESVSSSYSLKAGYQQMQEVFLSMTGGTSVVLSPSLGGLTGGVSQGSTSVVVLTDSPAGYQLTIQAENSPALVGPSATIVDYVPVSVPEADFTFTTGASEAHFGFSPEGSDLVSRYLDDGVDCGVGALESSLTCWDGLATTPRVIAVGGANQPTGATTTIQFRLEIGANATVMAGEYIATTTITAVPL